MVDAISPRVPLREHGLVEAVLDLQTVKIVAYQLPHLAELGLDFGEHVGWERAPQIGAENAVVVELVTEGGGDLKERHRREA